MQAAEIAQKLARDAEGVCRHLLPNGKRDGHEWRVGSVDGEEGKSLGVHLTGDKAGIWSDFSEGGGGDLLDLWRETRSLSMPEAMDEARSYLGVSAPAFEAGRTRRVQPIDKPKVQKARDAVAAWLMDERGLSEAAIEAYRIAADGHYVAFPYRCEDDLVAVKYRSIHDKHDCKVKKGDAMPLFGWQAVPDDAREVVITEGEIDAVSCWQMGYPALSVPNGAQGLTWIEVEYGRLERFDTIYVWMDSDEHGQAAVQAIVDRLGAHRCRVVRQKLGKDANDALRKGLDAGEFIRRAETLDPAELKSADQFTEEVIRGFYPPDDVPEGIRPPWQKAQGKLLFRPAEITVVSGINGHGKSIITSQIACDAMYQGHRVCIASMEMQPKLTLQRMIRQAQGHNGTEQTPSIPFIRTAQEWFSDKLWLFNVTGTTKADRMLEVFDYARRRYGIELFVVDSLAKCGMAEDDYNAQKAFIEALCDFKNEHSVHVLLVSHPRKSGSEEQQPGKMDVRGGQAITDLVDNGFTLWRNKKKQAALNLPESKRSKSDEEQIDMPDAFLTVWKQRNGEWEGKWGLWWKNASLQFVESESTRPMQYVSFQAEEVA